MKDHHSPLYLTHGRRDIGGWQGYRLTVYGAHRDPATRATLRILDDLGIRHEYRHASRHRDWLDQIPLPFRRLPVVEQRPLEGAVAYWCGHNETILNELAN